MARYIDKDLLLKDISESVVFTVRNAETSPELRGARKIIDRIKKTPTADVVEVKHGMWIDDGDCFHCSVCNKTYQLGSLQTIYDVKRCWQYCANCGAKMDGGKEE